MLSFNIHFFQMYMNRVFLIMNGVYCDNENIEVVKILAQNEVLGRSKICDDLPIVATATQ